MESLKRQINYNSCDNFGKDIEAARAGVLLVRKTSLCYNEAMKNWSTDTKKFDKKSDEYQIWRLEQLIGFGIGDEKISRKLLIKYFSKLNLDQAKRNYLSFLIKSI